jgi:hypothetical protein
MPINDYKGWEFYRTNAEVLHQWLRETKACPEAIAWARDDFAPDDILSTVWAEMENAHWMVWILTIFGRIDDMITIRRRIAEDLPVGLVKKHGRTSRERRDHQRVCNYIRSRIPNPFAHLPVVKRSG